MSASPVPARARRHLDDRDLETLERVLLEHRRARTDQLAALQLQPSDVAASPVSRELLVVRTLLDEIDGALARIADGTYGWCTRCTAEIDRARLYESPRVRHCERCAA